MEKKKVMVNLLNQGTVSTGLELKLFEWMREKTDKYTFNFFEPTDRPISNNRNKIAKRFLQGDWDILCMIDDDNPPLADKNIFDLMDFDKQVIGAVVPGRDKRGIHFHVYKFGDDYPDKICFKQYQADERKGLMQIDAIGTGCVFIKREVLEKVKRPFEDLFDKDGILVTNDDMHFCHKCRKKGIEIWTHWDYPCGHYKTVNLMQVAGLIVQAAKTGKPRLAE